MFYDSLPKITGESFHTMKHTINSLQSILLHLEKRYVYDHMTMAVKTKSRVNFKFRGGLTMEERIEQYMFPGNPS